MYYEIATEYRQKTPAIPRNDGRSSVTSLRGYMPAFKKIWIKITKHVPKQSHGKVADLKCFAPAKYTIAMYYEIATEFRQKSPKTPRNDGRDRVTSLRGNMPACKKIWIEITQHVPRQSPARTTSLRGYMPACKKIWIEITQHVPWQSHNKVACLIVLHQLLLQLYCTMSCLLYTSDAADE